MANQQTRSEVDAQIETITDPLFSQNTAVKVRGILKSLNRSAVNAADDGQPTPGASAGTFAALAGLPDQNAALAGRLRGIENRGPNLRPDGFKSVRFLTRTDPRFDQASDHALDELDTLLACIGTRCFVEFEEKHYVTRFDAAPRPGGPGTGPQCWRDGHMASPTPLVPARWVVEDSASAQVKDYTEYPAGFVFAPGTYVGAYVTSSTTEQFFKAIGPAGPRAAPVAGGNSQWELVSADQVPVTTTYQPVATISEATLVTLYNDAALGPYAGKLLLVTLSGNRGTLAVRVNGNGSLETEDAWLLSAANPDAQGVPVSVVVGATAVAVSPRGAAVTVRGDGIETSYQTLPDALANGTTDLVVSLNRGMYTLSADVLMSEGVLLGNQAIVNLFSGHTFTLRQVAAESVLFSGGAVAVSSVNNRLFRCRVFAQSLFDPALIVPAATSLLLENCEVFGVVQVAGTLTVIGCDLTRATFVLTGGGAVKNALTALTTLTPAATAQADTAFRATYNANLLLNRATTALSLTNVADGAQGTLFATQDTTGGRALTVPAGSVGFTQDAPALAANAVTKYTWINRAGTLYWEQHTYGATGTPAPAPGPDPTISNFTATPA